MNAKTMNERFEAMSDLVLYADARDSFLPPIHYELSRVLMYPLLIRTPTEEFIHYYKLNHEELREMVYERT